MWALDPLSACLGALFTAMAICLVFFLINKPWARKRFSDDDAIDQLWTLSNLIWRRNRPGDSAHLVDWQVGTKSQSAKALCGVLISKNSLEGADSNLARVCFVCARKRRERKAVG